MKSILYLLPIIYITSFASTLTPEEYESIRDLVFTTVRQEYNPENFATLMRAGNKLISSLLIKLTLSSIPIFLHFLSLGAGK